MVEDNWLYDVILNDPLWQYKWWSKRGIYSIRNPWKWYEEKNKEKLEKSHQSKKLLVCHIIVDEYNKISFFESSKEIWEYMQILTAGMSHVK